MTRMYNLCRILQHVVNGFDNVSLAQHHSVIERHQLVFHVYAQPCHQLYSILKEEVKQLLRKSPEIMAYGYHRGINECYAGTSSKSSQIKEEQNSSIIQNNSVTL